MNKYPEDMEEYIRGIAKGRLTSEIAEMVNARYGAGMSNTMTNT